MTPIFGRKKEPEKAFESAQSEKITHKQILGVIPSIRTIYGRFRSNPTEIFENLLFTQEKVFVLF